MKAVRYKSRAGNNSTSACFDCRRTWKSPGVPARCPECHGPLRDLGTTSRVPKRHRIKAWQELREWWRVRHAPAIARRVYAPLDTPLTLEGEPCTRSSG